MIGCDMLKLDSGGSEKDNEHLQTIAQAIMNDPQLGSLCQNGWRCTSRILVSGVSSHERQLNLQLQNEDDEIAVMILGLIHAPKSSYVRISSVTLLKWLPEQKIMKLVFREKLDWPLSLALSSLLLRIFRT